MLRMYRVSLLMILLSVCGIVSTNAQWTKITPFGLSLDYSSLAAIPNGSSGTYLFVGALGNGAYVSLNNGANWSARNTGLTDGEVEALATNGTTLYAGTLTKGAFYSTNNGTSWIQVDSGMNTEFAGVCYPVVSFGFAGSNVFAGTEYDGLIYRLNSDKTVWTGSSSFVSYWVSAFLNVSNTEFLAATGGGIVGSTDNGQTWSAHSTGMGKDTLVQCLAAVPNGSGGTTLIAGTNIENGNADGGILTSTNDGASWTMSDSGFTKDPYTGNNNWTITALAVSGTNVFAATNGGGLYVSSDQGKLWKKMNSTLNDSTFASLLIYHDTIYVAGLYGVYRAAVAQVTGVAEEPQPDVPKVFSLEQNYPNPFNPSTVIQFSVPSDGRATLKVYNVLGEEVKTLFDGMARAGISHQAVFDASHLASGIYFSRLEFEGRIEVKKMVLMK